MHTTTFIYGEGHQLLADRENGAWTNYVWFAGELVGMTRGGAMYQIDNDHLGRPELITNANKAVVWQSNNDPFGGMTTTTNTLGEFNIGLPGQYFDAESNYWYNMSRYYVPAIGRYLQADPVGLAGGLNPYAYVGGNPAKLIDPLGLQSRELSYEYRISGATPPSVGYHYYNIWVPLCAGGCTPTDAFNAMRNFSAPGAPPAQNGSRNLVLTGNNPINQTVDPCKMTITNVALPGHQFGGSVTISVQQRNGAVGAQIIGTGVGPNPIMNQLLGPIIFEALGFDAAQSLQGSGP